ncbi:MAG: hypothetical protein D6798_01050, partial [Deltaproteobacteria bacterium]
MFPARSSSRAPDPAHQLAIALIAGITGLSLVSLPGCTDKGGDTGPSSSDGGGADGGAADGGA